jgi:hypothetical protein
LVFARLNVTYFVFFFPFPLSAFFFGLSSGSLTFSGAILRHHFGMISDEKMKLATRGDIYAGV